MNSCIDFLLTRFRAHSGADAIVWHAKTYNYRWLVERVHHWHDYLVHNDIAPGTVIALKSDYSPNAIALLLALIEARCVIVPTTVAGLDKIEPEFAIQIDAHDDVVFSARTPVRSARYEQFGPSDRPLIVTQARGLPSGQTIAHYVLDLLVVSTTTPCALDRPIQSRNGHMPLMMLLPFDALSGLKLLFATLAQSGCVITVDDCSVDTLQATIQQHQIDITLQTQLMQSYGQVDIPPQWLQLVGQSEPAIAA